MACYPTNYAPFTAVLDHERVAAIAEGDAARGEKLLVPYRDWLDVADTPASSPDAAFDHAMNLLGFECVDRGGVYYVLDTALAERCPCIDCRNERIMQAVRDVARGQ